MTFSIFEQNNPFRSPGWRQDRVLSLVEHKPRPLHPDRELDDQYVVDYRTFLLKWRKSAEKGRVRLFRSNPGLYYAHSFKENPDADWRALLEARILAREPDEFIASQFHTLPEAVDWYEKLFFNVRDRLNSKSYIIRTVLGPSARHVTGYDDAITDTMRRACYRMFAYFGGPHVLDLMISGFHADAAPADGGKAQNWLDDATKACIQSRAALAARCFTINKWNTMQLLELQQRFVQAAEAARIASGGAGAEYLENIERFLDSIELKIGNKATVGRTAQAMEFEKSAVEPNFDEQLALVRGEVPATLRMKSEFKRPAIMEKESAHVAANNE